MKQRRFAGPIRHQTGLRLIRQIRCDIAYNAEADSESWKELKTFFHTAFPKDGSQ